jgi:hypothetical protein
MGLVTGILSVVLVALAARQPRSHVWWFVLLTWTPVVLLFLISQWRPIYLERALLPSALMMLVTIGWLLADEQLPGAVRIAFGVLLTVSTIGSLAAHYTYQRFPRPPFREAAAYLRARVTAEDAVIHTNKLTYFPMHVYAPDLPQTFLADPPGSGQDTLAYPTQQALGIFPSSNISEAVGAASNIWMVYFPREVAEFADLGLKHPALTWIEARYALSATERFEDLTVAYYKQESP